MYVYSCVCLCVCVCSHKINVTPTPPSYHDNGFQGIHAVRHMV